jgi:hypothetical protein
MAPSSATRRVVAAIGNAVAIIRALIRYLVVSIYLVPLVPKKVHE